MTKKTTPWMARQGDVLLMSAKLDTAGHTQISNGVAVLALGEVTGHKHQIIDPGVCLLSREGISDRVVMLAAEALLVHEEHSSITVPPGTHIVRVQREFVETNVSRSVED